MLYTVPHLMHSDSLKNPNKMKTEVHFTQDPH